MEKTYVKEDMRLNQLREDFEAGKISQEEMNVEDAILLNFKYELELLSLNYEIEEQREILEEYKARLKEAIEFLKNKRNM